MVEAVLGIDVGKHKLHVALLLAEKKPKPKVIANTPEGHQALLQWLQQQGVNQVHACLEATSTYGEAVAAALHEAGHLVSIVNPARIGGFAKSELSRTKTDNVDAVIARFCAAVRPSLWVPPAPEVKHLQALVRRLDPLKEMYQQESNRLETAMTQLSPLIDEHLKYLKQDIQRTEQLLKDHFEQHPTLKQRDLLTTLPGIAQTTASLILAEIVSWQAFETAKQLAAYIGLTPQQRTSG